jgi:deleted-in-malignant-brain-tumors protein 1
VELWREEKWGTVCDDSWDLRDGGVVCAQLGCGPALNVSGQDGSFEAGVGLVLLDEVNCGGSERNLWECPSLGTVNDCGHKEDAAVVCSGKPVAIILSLSVTVFTIMSFKNDILNVNRS